MRLDSLNNVVHLLCGFAHGKTSDGVTRQVKLCNALHMVHTNIRINAALVDAPKHLLFINSIGQSIQPGIFSLAAL